MAVLRRHRLAIRVGAWILSREARKVGADAEAAKVAAAARKLARATRG